MYTKGKWEIHEHNHINGEFWCSIGISGFGPITEIVGEEGNKTEFFQPVAAMKYLVTPVEEQKANARRICQCVNNFDGLLNICKTFKEASKKANIKNDHIMICMNYSDYKKLKLVKTVEQAEKS